MTAPKTQINRPEHAGKIASNKVIHGDHSRYATYAIHTRSRDVQWVTADAYKMDEATGAPGIIRQAETFEEAMSVS